MIVRRFRDLTARTERLAQRYVGQAEPINRFVDELMVRFRRDDIPYIDPSTGGVGASLILLLPDPGPKAVGDEAASQMLSMWGGNGQGRRSISESLQREELAPESAIRQMFPGQAVLIHGTLPPVPLEAIRWWREKALADLVPVDANGDPVPPKILSTCPLTDQPAPDTDEEIVDQRTLDATVEQLPKPRKTEWPTQRGSMILRRRSAGSPTANRPDVAPSAGSAKAAATD